MKTLLKNKTMKLESNNLLENLTRGELEILTAEVNETVAKDFKNKKKRIFSVGELWDIQRRRRNLLVKRMMF